MRSEELADEVQDLIEACRARILGVGNQQYSDGDRQKFETMDLDELFVYMQEELEDVVNYAAMLRIRLRRVREVLSTL